MPLAKASRRRQRYSAVDLWDAQDAYEDKRVDLIEDPEVRERVVLILRIKFQLPDDVPLKRAYKRIGF